MLATDRMHGSVDRRCDDGESVVFIGMRRQSNDATIGAFTNNCQAFPMAVDGMKMHAVTDSCGVA
jgi:hypothetical protein